MATLQEIQYLQKYMQLGEFPRIVAHRYQSVLVAHLGESSQQNLPIRGRRQHPHRCSQVESAAACRLPIVG